MLRQQIPFFELNGEHEAEIQRMPHEPVGQRRAERHRCVQREAGRLLAASIPGAEFIELDSRNHILLEDQPASRRFQEAVLEFARPDRAVSAAAFAGLSEREPEVLALITDGLSNTDIAARLSSSEKTVRNHTSNVFDKLGVWSRAQAIVFARDHGFTSD